MSDVVMVYFVIGAVMVGGGALEVGNAGIADFFVSEGDNGTLQPAQNTTEQIQNTGGAISTVVSLAVGGILLVWSFVQGLFTYLNWPIFVLLQHNAPPMAVLLLGGSFTAAFYLAIAGLLWRAT